MIGKIIKAKREAIGLTQNEVAEYLSISPQAISKWERDIADPTIEYLPKLAKIFECAIEDFFEVEKFSGDNLKLTESLFIKLSREGNFEDAKTQLFSNDNEFEFIEALFSEIKERIKDGYETLNCSDIQERFNFGYLRAMFVIDWLVDIGILEKEVNSTLKTTIINEENFYRIQSALVGDYDVDYYQDISMRTINEFFDSFDNNKSNIVYVFNKSKALKNLITIIYKELKNKKSVCTSILQAWFDIDFEKANRIFERLKESGIVVKKYGVAVGDEEKMSILEKYL